MKRAPAKIPLLVLAQALVVGIIVGTPILFVAFNQIRRACGDRLFGSREHFCSARELWTWLPLLPHWIFWIAPPVALAGFAMAHRSRMKNA